MKNTGLVVLAVLVPLVGLIAGAVMLGTKSAGAGAVLIGALGGFLLWSVVFGVMGA